MEKSLWNIVVNECTSSWVWYTSLNLNSINCCMTYRKLHYLSVSQILAGIIITGPCETPTILTGKIHVLFSGLSDNELVAPGFTRNQFFITLLDLVYLLYGHIHFSCEWKDSLFSRRISKGRHIPLGKCPRAIHTTPCCGILYTTHQLWLWTQDSYTHEGSWSWLYLDVRTEHEEYAVLTGQYWLEERKSHGGFCPGSNIPFCI